MFFFAFMFLVGSWCVNACNSNTARHIEWNYENVLSKVTHDQSAKTLKYFCIFLLQRIYLKYLAQKVNSGQNVLWTYSLAIISVFWRFVVTIIIIIIIIIIIVIIIVTGSTLVGQAWQSLSSTAYFTLQSIASIFHVWVPTISPSTLPHFDFSSNDFGHVIFVQLSMTIALIVLCIAPHLLRVLPWYFLYCSASWRVFHEI